MVHSCVRVHTKNIPTDRTCRQRLRAHIFQRPAGLTMFASLVAVSVVCAASNTTPCPPAEAACMADPNCHAFGIHDGGYQLHGCSDAAALVPNNDWTIYVHTSATAASQRHTTVAAGGWTPLSGKVTVDEAKCPTHPQSSSSIHKCTSPGPARGVLSFVQQWLARLGHLCQNRVVTASILLSSAYSNRLPMFEEWLRKSIDSTKAGPSPSHPSHTHPVPPPVPGRPYEQVGSIDVGTLENTIFWWANATYVLENIGCGYVDHAGHWFPAFANHSYARVRNFKTGRVVANISTSVGFGFVNAFPDYDHNRLWLFGTPTDRCHGNCGTCQGPSCPGRPSCTSIQSWWTSLPVPTSFETAVAIPVGAELTHTYNQGVARVRVPGPGMPQHRYVMISEPNMFFINNDPDGNLTAAGGGWTLVPDQHAPPGAGGGVSMQWAVDETSTDTNSGWYYSVTGGSSVGFARSRDLKVWEGGRAGYRVAISQQVGQYQLAPYNGFNQSAVRKGWPAMADPSNWDVWGYDNNDGDLCCADQPAAIAAGHGRSPFGWLVWGASTQGVACGLAQCSTNAVGRFTNMSLPQLLASYFE